MARTASPAHRQQLEQMAETWEQLAEARKRQLEKQGKTVDDEISEQMVAITNLS
jgi:ferric-dicitrate binding protein FerR (iron transport regulator)